MLKGEIKTLYENAEKTKAIFPTTKMRAVTNDNGKALDALLFDDYATKSHVAAEIAKAQLEGEDVDLSGFATKDDLNLAKNDINQTISGLTAANVGAAPAGFGLGVERAEKEISDCDLAVRNGWYLVTGNASNAPWTLSSWMRVDAYNENYLMQTIYNEANGGMVAQRLKAKTFGDWVRCDPSSFASSDYGLGKTNGKVCTNCNEAIENGFYTLSGDSLVNGPVNSGTNYGNLLVLNRYSNNHITQIATYSGYMAIRWYVNGEWNAWEWINPPTLLGVEYRTTERWSDGKPVYTRLVTCGAATNNKAFDLPEDMGSLVRHSGWMSKMLMPVGDFARGTTYAYTHYSSSGAKTERPHIRN